MLLLLFFAKIVDIMVEWNRLSTIDSVKVLLWSGDL